MKIYLAHATKMDYQNDLYQPLQESTLWSEHTWVLSHATGTDITFDSRPVIKDCDLMIADVSVPSTGVGIEMGWAVAHEVKIMAIHKAGTVPSGAVVQVTGKVTPYQDANTLVTHIKSILNESL
jgi:nucleoside 2-deoxyribosyltransferase